MALTLTQDDLNAIGALITAATSALATSAALAVVDANVDAIIVDTDATLPALFIDTVDAYLGTDARTVVVTVNDGTTVLEGARVRLTSGTGTFVGTTSVSGVVTFNLDDATYTIAITKAGYSYTGSTLVVDGNETKTCSMTVLSFSISDPDQATGWIYCYNYNGEIESGVTIQVQQTITQEASSYAFDKTIYSGTSDTTGLVQFTGLWVGATYQARRAGGTWHSFVVPDATSFALPAMLGR